MKKHKWLNEVLEKSNRGGKAGLGVGLIIMAAQLDAAEYGNRIEIIDGVAYEIEEDKDVVI